MLFAPVRRPSGNDKVSGQVKEDSKTRRRRKTGAYHEGARPTTAKSIIQRDENGDLSDSASSRPANPLTCPPQQQLSLTWSFDSRRIICGGWGGEQHQSQHTSREEIKDDTQLTC
jgi:hypothetical protein